MRRLVMYYVLYLIVTVCIGDVIGTEGFCDLTQGQKIICESDSDVISLKCPAAHKLSDLQATVYRQQSAADCPKAFDSSGSCEYKEAGIFVTQELQTCNGSQFCTSVKLSPILNPISCQTKGFTGSVFYMITYICKPDITYVEGEDPLSPLSMNEANVVSASSLNINSIKSAPMGNFIGRLDRGCTVDLPAGSSLLIKLKYFEKKSAKSPCDQLIYLEHGKEFHKLCSKNDTPIYLACDDGNRQITIRYSTNNANVSIVFGMHLEVPPQYRMKVTCGIPMDDGPLLTPAGGPYVTEEVAGRAIAIGCVIGALLIILIIVAIIEMRKRRRRQQYNIYEYHATINKGDSSVETSEPTFVIESDKKVLVEDSPTVQYSGIY